MTAAGDTFLDDRKVRMRVVDVVGGRRGPVVFCRDERGREHRVGERELAHWTAVRPRFAAARRPELVLLVAEAGEIACVVDDRVGLRVVSGFEEAVRLLGFQADYHAATLSVVAGASWAADQPAQQQVAAGRMRPVFELWDGSVVQLPRAVLEVLAPERRDG